MFGLAQSIAQLAKRVDIMNALAPRLSGRFWQLKDVSYGPGAEQAYDLYIPMGDTTNCPIFVFIPGGAWRRGNKESYGFVGRRFAAHGITTAVISYRLAPRGRYPDFIKDAIEAVGSVSRLAQHLSWNHKRLYVGGYSAGAYNAVQMVLGNEMQSQSRLAMTDIAGVIAISGKFDISRLRGLYIDEAFGESAGSADVLPQNFIRSGVPPMLFIVGDEDRNALPKESLDLASALKRVGAESDVKIYCHSGHKKPISAVAFPILGRTVRDCVSFMNSHAHQQRAVNFDIRR